MKLLLIGDSTMQTNRKNTYPQMGWGQIVPMFFRESLEIVNFGKNKLSTRTAFDLGIFQNLLELVDDKTFVDSGIGLGGFRVIQMDIRHIVGVPCLIARTLFIREIMILTAGTFKVLVIFYPIRTHFVDFAAFTIV